MLASLPSVLVHSRADSTVRNYYYAFEAWSAWAKMFHVTSLPAQPVSFAFYLLAKIQQGANHHNLLTKISYVQSARIQSKNFAVNLLVHRANDAEQCATQTLDGVSGQGYFPACILVVHANFYE